MTSPNQFLGVPEPLFRELSIRRIIDSGIDPRPRSLLEKTATPSLNSTRSRDMEIAETIRCVMQYMEPPARFGEEVKKPLRDLTIDDVGALTKNGLRVYLSAALAVLRLKELEITQAHVEARRAESELASRRLHDANVEHERAGKRNRGEPTS